MRFDSILTRLRANADVFAALTRDVDAEQARWKPESSQWSILEVVNHLADEELDDFRTRLDMALNHPGEPWPPIDPEGWAVERGYNERGLEESVARFLARRRDSIAWLGALEDPDWSRAGRHPRMGPLSAGALLTSWLAHDHIHVRQINRLQRDYLVRVLSSEPADYAGRW